METEFDETRMDKRGIRAYLSKNKLIDIFEKHIKQEIEKTYEVHDTSDERKNIASFTVGVSRMDVEMKVNFNLYYIDFNEKENNITLVLRDQQVNGKIQLHVDKKAVIIVDLGDYINKEYRINFLLILRQLTFTLKVKPQADGMPRIDVQLSLQELNLTRDLNYHVENPDLLTNVVALVKGLWMSELEKEIHKRLLPKINSEIGSVINSKVSSIYKTDFHIDGEENLKVNLECKHFCVRNDFAILTLNGFFNNAVKPRKMYSILPQDYYLPDISKVIGEDFALIQVSDDVLHSLINGYFQNELSWQEEFTEAGAQQITIKHSPKDQTMIEIRRDEDIYGSDIHLLLETIFSVAVKHSFLPEIKINARIKLKASNLKIRESADTPDHVLIEYRVSHIELLDLFDFKMKPLSETTRKSKMVSVICEKTRTAVIDRDIKVKKIRIGNESIFEKMNYVVYDDFITIVGRLKI